MLIKESEQGLARYSLLTMSLIAPILIAAVGRYPLVLFKICSYHVCSGDLVYLIVLFRRLLRRISRGEFARLWFVFWRDAVKPEYKYNLDTLPKRKIRP